MLRDAQAQTLEGVCLVFLHHYAENFAANHPGEHVLDILVKTQRMISARARAAGLDFGFPASVFALYRQGLSDPGDLLLARPAAVQPGRILPGMPSKNQPLCF